VAAVSAGGPGEKGGLKEDDLIVEVAGKQVRNMAGYMTAMKLQKKGQEMEMVVIRGGKRVPLKITPQ
jgi:serine protease Do